MENPIPTADKAAPVGADFQHSLPPQDDRLTGGASLRDYLAAQALRSHYIISRTSGKDVEYLADFCYDIADTFLAKRAQYGR